MKVSAVSTTTFGFLCLGFTQVAARLLKKSDSGAYVFDPDDKDYYYQSSGGYYGDHSKGGNDNYDYFYGGGGGGGGYHDESYDSKDDSDKHDYHYGGGGGGYYEESYDYDYNGGDSYDQDYGDVDYGYHHGGGGSSGGERDYGFLVAKDLWKNGKKYDCDNIVQKYWNDVRKIVFSECDHKWSYWPDRSRSCKKGAEEFTKQQIGKCFETKDCWQLGVAAAGSVSGTICSRQGLYKDRQWLPRKCRKHAAVSCKCDAVNTVYDFKESGVCGNVHGSVLEYVDKIHNMCDREIDAMIGDAELPW